MKMFGKMAFWAVLLILVLLFLWVSPASGEFSGPSYYLVTDSYLCLENALDRADFLFYDMGYDSKIMNVPVEGDVYWRVVVGEDREKEVLIPLQKELESIGISAFFVFHGEYEPVREAPVPEERHSPDATEIIDAIYRHFDNLEEFLMWLGRHLHHK